MLLTPFRAVNRHEKYVANETERARRQEEKERRTYVSGGDVEITRTTDQPGEETEEWKPPSDGGTDETDG